MQQKPSELELQILSVLWDNGELTVKDLLSKMPDGKKRAYTTILSTVQKMEKKGFLDHKSVGNTHLYFPIISRKKTLGSIMKEMVKNVFGGKVTNVMQTLLTDEVDRDEIDALKKMLEDNHE